MSHDVPIPGFLSVWQSVWVCVTGVQGAIMEGTGFTSSLPRFLRPWRIAAAEGEGLRKLKTLKGQ